MLKLQWIVDSETFTAGNIAIFINHFLICIEMFVLALFHRIIFGYEEFKKEFISLEDGKEKIEPHQTNVINSIMDASVFDILESLNIFGRQKSY